MLPEWQGFDGVQGAPWEHETQTPEPLQTWPEPQEVPAEAEPVA